MINAEMIINSIKNNPNFRNNTVMQNALTMYQNGDNKGLTELCENVCKSNGTSVEEMRKKYGI